MEGDPNLSLTEPAKLLLLASILAKDRMITLNGKAFFKELILRRDPRLHQLLESFDTEGQDVRFLDKINDLIDEEANAHYDRLFAGTTLEDGKKLSKSERENKNLNDVKSLIYGEVEFRSFSKVLRKMNPKPGTTFYDLGSGTGRAIFIARFLYDFDRCKGIEILENLHDAAVNVVDRYNAEFRHVLSAGNSQDVAVFHGSLDPEDADFNDWSDGDVVFANSTCFEDRLMEKLSKQAEHLKPGAFVVTFTKGLTSNKFEVMERKRRLMSWGPATVFIHRRLNADGTAYSTEQLMDIPDDDSYNEFEDDDDDDDDSDDFDPNEDDDDDEGDLADLEDLD